MRNTLGQKDVKGVWEIKEILGYMIVYVCQNSQDFTLKG